MYGINCVLSMLMLTLSKVLVAAFLVYAFYSFRRRDDYALLKLCSLMSIIIMIVGIGSVWFSGLQMWQSVGVAGDISLDLIFEGWKHSFRPMIWSILTAFILMGVGFAGPHFKNRVTKKVTDPALAFVILTSLPIIAIVLSTVILELAPARDHFYTIRYTGWQGDILHIAITALITMSIIGGPVLVWWAFKIRSFLRSNPAFHRKRILIAYFVLCVLLVISGLLSLSYAYMKHSFYHACWLF